MLNRSDNAIQYKIALVMPPELIRGLDSLNALIKELDNRSEYVIHPVDVLDLSSAVKDSVDGLVKLIELATGGKVTGTIQPL